MKKNIRDTYLYILQSQKHKMRHSYLITSIIKIVNLNFYQHVIERKLENENDMMGLAVYRVGDTKNVNFFINCWHVMIIV